MAGRATSASVLRLFLLEGAEITFDIIHVSPTFPTYSSLGCRPPTLFITQIKRNKHQEKHGVNVNTSLLDQHHKSETPLEILTSHVKLFGTVHSTLS